MVLVVGNPVFSLSPPPPTNLKLSDLIITPNTSIMDARRQDMTSFKKEYKGHVDQSVFICLTSHCKGAPPLANTL